MLQLSFAHSHRHPAADESERLAERAAATVIVVQKNKKVGSVLDTFLGGEKRFEDAKIIPSYYSSVIKIQCSLFVCLLFVCLECILFLFLLIY